MSSAGARVIADPIEETRRILAAAEDAAVPMRAVGGIAVALRAPTILTLAPPRSFHDIDLVARGGRSPGVGELFASLGYEAAERFNKLNGAERLLFHDPGGRRVDVFVDRLRMCHTLELADRLELEPMTVPLADLALTKLQIVEMTPRDAQDLAALFADHPLVPPAASGIEVGRIVSVCAEDWGWWRTVSGSLHRLRDGWTAMDEPTADRAATHAAALIDALDAAPKSAAWRARSWLGERKRWYELPEEVR